MTRHLCLGIASFLLQQAKSKQNKTKKDQFRNYLFSFEKVLTRPSAFCYLLPEVFFTIKCS